MKSLSYFTITLAILSCTASKNDNLIKRKGYSIDPHGKKGKDGFEVKMFNDDKEVPLMGVLNSGIVPILTTNADTANIMFVSMLMPSGIGLGIKFYNDTCEVLHFNAPRNREPRFMYNLEDKDYKETISIKPKKYTLALYDSAFTNNKVSGFVDFESEDYYSLTGGKNTNEFIKYRYMIKGYFTAKDMNNIFENKK